MGSKGTTGDVSRHLQVPLFYYWHHPQHQNWVHLTQFHVVCDDPFATIPNANSRGLLQDNKLSANDWITLQNNRERCLDNNNVDKEGRQLTPPELDDQWLTDDELKERIERRLHKHDEWLDDLKQQTNDQPQLQREPNPNTDPPDNNKPTFVPPFSDDLSTTGGSQPRTPSPLKAPPPAVETTPLWKHAKELNPILEQPEEEIVFDKAPNADESPAPPSTPLTACSGHRHVPNRKYFNDNFVNKASAIRALHTSSIAKDIKAYKREKGCYPKQRFKSSGLSTYHANSSCRTRSKIATQ